MDPKSSQPLTDTIKKNAPPKIGRDGKPIVKTTASGQPLPPESTESDYINNPWTLAVTAVKLVFAHARNVAWVLIVISVLSAFSGSFNQNASQTTPTTYDPNATVTEVVFPGATLDGTFYAIVTLAVVAIIAITLLSMYIAAVGQLSSLRAIKGQTTTISEAMTMVNKKFWGYVLLQIFVTFRIILWSILLILPGIYMSVRYSLASVTYLDDDNTLTPTQAIKKSVELTRGAWLTTFASPLLLSVVTLGLISQLVSCAAQAKLYMQYKPLTEQNIQKPRAHFLSFAMLGFMLLLIPLIFLIALAAIALSST